MKIGIFGAGQMGGAMIKGWVNSGGISPSDILVKGGSGKTALTLQEKIPFSLAKDLSEFNQVDIIFLAVNTPSIIPTLENLTDVLTKDIPIVSVSAGEPLTQMQHIVGNDYPIAQAIPNTPVQINQGITGIVFTETIKSEDKQIMLNSLNYLGLVEEITPEKIDAFGTLAGCAPAFVDVFIEALGDAGVLHGLNRQLAYTVAAKMMSGSANLLLETKKHPAELKDEVTSPGGTTIKGIATLEKEGFRHAIIEAVNSIMETYN